MITLRKKKNGAPLPEDSMRPYMAGGFVGSRGGGSALGDIVSTSLGSRQRACMEHQVVVLSRHVLCTWHEEKVRGTIVLCCRKQ